MTLEVIRGVLLMKKIILASGSKQRRRLLKLLGLKFSVIPSRVEEKTEIVSTCAALVKQNALLKAMDVASRLKEGIVIGADSVVYMGNKKIIGKPSTKEEAKQILRALSSSPQWVYTGIAVIDVEQKERLIDYEKTKVFMNPLTDEEIDSYHSRVPPFEKAGGFDIEGLGSIFIYRIEGCYTNVIGLPMARLVKMLKKMGIKIL